MSAADVASRPGSPLPAIIGGLLLGCAIGYVDSRPTWDDTGITVGAILLASFLVAALAPRQGWVAGLLVGLPVLLFNVAATGQLASAIALVFAAAGAGLGAGLGKLFRG